MSQFQLPLLNDDAATDVAPPADERKASIQRAFARAADDYDRHADVQREVAELLAQRLADVDPGKSCQLANVLELGCGTGLYTQLLRERYPSAELIAVDFCPAMLERARSKLAADSAIRWELADIEADDLYQHLPGCQLVTSSGTLQWLTRLDEFLANLRPVLQSTGMLSFASFGPDTFCELRDVLAAAGLSSMEIPAAQFPNAERLHTLLGKHFDNVEIEQQTLSRSYPTLLDELRVIRQTGTSGPRSPIRWSRALLERLDRIYLDRHGAIRSSYEVYFVQARGVR